MLSFFSQSLIVSKSFFFVESHVVYTELSHFSITKFIKILSIIARLLTKKYMKVTFQDITQPDLFSIQISLILTFWQPCFP